jgi:hypothetical protein
MAAQTRFLVVSDTHGQWPFTNSHSTLPADDFLHCGDLTQVGGLASLKRAFDDIKTIDAPLKLRPRTRRRMGAQEHGGRRRSRREQSMPRFREIAESGEGVHDF